MILYFDQKEKRKRKETNTKESHVVRRGYLDCKKIKDGFSREVTSINIVSHKHIMSVLRHSCNLKNGQKVVELSMNITDNCV